MVRLTDDHRLDPTAKKLLDAARVGKTLQDFIARVKPSEDQIAIAGALYKDGIDRQSLLSALSTKASAGHRRRIIDRCKEIVEED